MSKVYTFPTQAIAGGNLVVQITTSTGVGAESVSEKYFSDDVLIVDETEFFGGEIQSPYLDIIVAYDYNNLFTDTILPVSFMRGEWVKVKVTFNGVVRFVGSIIPTTNSRVSLYATNDALDGGLYSIKFRCKWLLNMLEDIPIENVYTDIIATPTKVITKNGRDAGGQDYSVSWTSFPSMVDSILKLLNSAYGFTYSVSLEQIKQTYFSKDSVDDQFGYMYPTISSIGDIDFGSMGGAYTSVGQIISENGFPVAYFNPNDSVYLGNAYNALLQFLKSFGLSISFDYSDSVDIILNIGMRTSGSLVTISQMLSHEEVPFAELARSSVKISSLASGNSYEEYFGSFGTSPYSDNFLFDYHNDAEMAGGRADNSIRSISFPTVGGFQLVREIGVGDNLVSNHSFDTDLSGWSVVSGTWVHSSVDIGNGAGCARVTLNTTDEQELKQTLAEPINDDIILSVRLGGNINIPLTIKFKFYSGSRIFSITKVLPTAVTIFGTRIVYGVRRMSGQARFSPIDAVSITVQSPDNYGSFYVYADRVLCFRDREGTPELAGKQIRDYFANNLLRRKLIVIDGVINGLKTRDYFVFGGENYYIKKVAYDLKQNQTEIEAINYPY